MNTSAERKNTTPLVDIDKICELQHKVDAYEVYLTILTSYIMTDDKIDADLILCDTPMDRFIEEAWPKLQEMKKKLSK